MLQVIRQVGASTFFPGIPKVFRGVTESFLRKQCQVKMPFHQSIVNYREGIGGGRNEEKGRETERTERFT
ncbi:hypothetical protein CEXT_62931 [Caerostris extrusa]|uniref:Uncharacterized protein n=1 Tax=Caerostris extrusa TaxID=172846 RepID=A0AAV4XPU7_CAEEX|nr:hypothetical protein CEXT_62931 [Caerostris extrusa]